MTRLSKQMCGALAALALAGAPADAWGQKTERDAKAANKSSEKQTDEKEAGLGEQDRKFLTEALKEDFLTVKMAQLAVDRAYDQGVKTLAQRIVLEANERQKSLALLAEDRDLMLPVGEGLVTSPGLEQLRQLSGRDFDARFTQELRGTQARSAELYRAEVLNGTDDELVEFAAASLPQVNLHRALARAAGPQAQGAR